MTADSLVERVGERLVDSDATVAVAESSTGGLVCSRLTDVPGSSAYFERGVVSYSNAAKVDLLDVERETLASHGAVSEPTARQMARGVRDLAGTTWAVSTTGVAGPGGGTPRTPVGTVYVAVACDDRVVSARRHEFDGDRDECKRQFTRQALENLLTGVESVG